MAWWTDAVFYEVYVRSYADSDGDGIGDLAGLTSRLDHLVDLGVDALWLTPFYPSPLVDGGYDVADPRDVDPILGDLAAFDALVAAAHQRGLRVVVDVVPNHTSDQRDWFAAALRDGPGSPARARYLFRDGGGQDGSSPPNNWESTFGGPAWTRVPDGQWYLHLFAAEQPDLNWRHPDVPVDALRTLTFWLDRGADGFRIDVAHGLFKAEGLPDDRSGGEPDLMADVAPDTPMWNQPEVHEVYRSWHQLLATYPQQPTTVGEVWLGDPREVARYLRPGELHMAFNFRLLKAPWEAPALRTAVEKSLAADAEVGAPTTWVLSNHDVERHASRYGGGETGQRRARAALLLLLALPGPVFLYQGEELGLDDVDVPDDAKQDPQWLRSGGQKRSRDGCRVPLPWDGAGPPYGFTTGEPWLPMPSYWAGVTMADQASDPASMLSFYREALRIRRGCPPLGRGALTWHSEPRADVVDLTMSATGQAVRVMVNLGATTVPLPAGDVLLRSAGSGGELGTDDAVWVAVPG